jgi:hypothetical protein
MEKIISEIKGKVKRWMYCNFKKNTTQKLLEKRRGECLQCGKCCEILFRCPFLWVKDGKKRCLIYHTGRPKQCIFFPIFRDDLKSVDYKCGYRFD